MMVQKNDLQSKSKILKEQVRGKVWYKLLYGEFKNRDQAEVALQSLPEALKVAEPWLRKFNG